ncbi:hypothetical protein LCGC14_1613180 [marine sediment metagenome]|uniref:Uncharacterized protein n=1 Tax=marine sediment metagenome TaxID=412755 RepID=A0A0F9KNE9_9ZZZZ
MMGDSEVTIGSGSLALALLFIAFWGEPDLVDALIQHFMNGAAK